jgi:pimeloyl-ACP methyl ester carboxylesterase
MHYVLTAETSGHERDFSPRDVARALRAAQRSAHRILLSLVVIAGIALNAGSCTATPSDSASVIVDGRSVAYRVLGSGDPVVVMLAGLGDGMDSFEDVAPDIARVATVIIYDRAGYGGSAAASSPRDAEAVDRELSGLLAQIGVRGPYVLLGHSVGGLYAEYIAAKHGDQVTGLILEESRPADFTRRCEAAQAGWCTPPELLTWLMPTGAQDEFEALAATIAQVESARSVSGQRVMILSRSTPEEPTAIDALWAHAQADLAARYAGSQHLTATHAGHYIHQDERAWFVASIATFLKR